MSRKAPEIGTKSPDEISFGTYVFSTGTNELSSASGEAIALRSQPAEVLAESLRQTESKAALIEKV